MKMSVLNCALIVRFLLLFFLQKKYLLIHENLKR